MHTWLHESDPGARLVDVPDVETLVLLQTLLKLIGSKTLCQDALTSLVKPGECNVVQMDDYFKLRHKCWNSSMYRIDSEMQFCFFLLVAVEGILMKI